MNKFVQFVFEYSIFVVVAFGFGMILWLFPPDKIISIAWFIAIIFPLVALLLMLFRHIGLEALKNKDSVMKLPRLKLIQEGRYIFEPSTLFADQSLVALYYIDEIERYVGYGYVESVISDTQNLQVIISELTGTCDEKFLTSHKKQIVLKPSIPRSVLLENNKIHTEDNKND
jgi:hypothetical protein